MKKIYFLFLITLMAFSGFAQNLAVNGSFENWTAGAPDGYTTLDFSTTDLTENTNATYVSEGTSSASVNLLTQDQANTDIKQTVSLTGGVTYTISLDVYATNNEARARIFNGDGYNPSAYSDETLLNQWQTISFEYTPSTNEDFDLGIRFYDIASNWTAGTQSSLFYIDNLQVVAATTPSIAVTSPSNGATIASSDVDIELSVQNFVVDQLPANGGTGDGHIHYTVDGGSNVMKYDTDPISLTGLADGEHTVELTLVDNSHVPLDPAVTASVTFTVTSLQAVADIASLRAGTIGNVYQITGEVVVTFVTGNSRNQIFIEDATGGMLIDDNSGTITTVFNNGDGITGLQGQLGEFANVMQFVPSVDPGAASSTGNSITPQTVTVNDIINNFDMYESELVSIADVTFADGNGTATFDSSQNYDISDVSGGPLTFRTNYPNDNMAGETIPSTATTITVIAGEYFGTPQVYPRSPDEVLSINNPNAIASFSVYPNPTSTGFVNITSSSSETISVNVYDMLGKQVINETIANNRLNVSTLNAGVYIMKISQGNTTTTQKIVIK
ncbi:T9SS type A sorting domain-containing protein [Gaetbulibacter jejuensis]|uniref:T9SS type A sorting domain-containing protein n=1 Tax=Gaetbulibacter jejuensis TaxID=584607 RepID=UPI00300B2793